MIARLRSASSVSGSVGPFLPTRIHRHVLFSFKKFKDFVLVPIVSMLASWRACGLRLSSDQAFQPVAGSGDVFQDDAVDGATGGNNSHPVQTLGSITVCIVVAADDCIHWTGLDAQGATDAPVFIDEKQRDAILPVHSGDSFGNRRAVARLTPYSFDSAGRLLVDGRLV
jgi:hypothetical protein